MSNKATSIYFVVFGILYLGYTSIIAGHGIHFTNLAVTLFVGILALYYYIKYREESITNDKSLK